MNALERFADASVLVIDDTEANVALLRAVLTRAGLRNLHLHTDPRQAVDQLDQIEPDLVLVDLHMPHLDGYAVLDRLRVHAGGAYLPALVLTADTSAQAIQRALSSGARDFLTKPFDAIEVILRVRNLLETRDLHQQLRRHNQCLRAQLAGSQLNAQHEQDQLQIQRARILGTIAEEALQVVFQPVFDLTFDSVVGLEALARFPGQPRRGPDIWFAEAARVGLGVELEALAVRSALRALPDLPGGVFLAVNVSPATLLSEQLQTEAAHDAWPRVVLELTEHVPVEDYDVLHAAAAVLRGHGARLAADDAGAGYAGFRHLLGLRADIIKADLSLIRNIDTDPARRALTSALVQFTRDTSTHLIAEGVETPGELDTLRGLGVRWAQGYHLARPHPLPDALAVCKRYPPR